MQIKRVVDRRRRPGQFLLSGSANFSLLKGVSETLAGRAIYLTLHPFSRREIAERTKEPPFLASFLEHQQLPRGVSVEPLAEQEILTGGMPSVALGEVKKREIWFTGYVQTYLERDVRDLSQVADLVSFRHLMRLAAFRTGGILKQSELARDAKLSSSTTTRYLNLLETSFIIHRLPPSLRSRAARLIKSPKLYFADSGVAAHLASVDSLDAAGDEPMRGALFETYVAQNLSSIIEAHLPGAELGFWHVQGRHEVDFVVSVSRGRVSIGIEVKAASRFYEHDLAGLRAFADKTRGVQALILATNGREAAQLDKDLFVIPLGLLLS
jgi:predicted AAA+ superfamily ATPase